LLSLAYNPASLKQGRFVDLLRLLAGTNLITHLPGITANEAAYTVFLGRSDACMLWIGEPGSLVGPWALPAERLGTATGVRVTT
jgi:hypothetical protein